MFKSIFVIYCVFDQYDKEADRDGFELKPVVGGPGLPGNTIEGAAAPTVAGNGGLSTWGFKYATGVLKRDQLMSIFTF